jgi:hypothetical protein
MLLDPASYQDMQFGLNSPLLTPRVAKSPLYARMFDRFGPQMDPSSPYQVGDDDKRKLFKQGLLQFAAAVSRPNGGNLANSIASGLLAARGGLEDGAQQHINDAYRADVMNRTRADMAANTAKQTAYSHLWGDDNQLSPQGEAEVRKADPMGYLSIYDKLHPQETAWQPKEVTFNGNAGTVLWNAKTGEMKTLDGQPFNAGGAQVAAAPQATPQAAPGGSALDAAVQQVESGGNPFAVSPKGALGPMQTMPGTLTDPGFGVTPARDNSPEEQRRVGIEYLHALMSKFGTQGGLAAYNWGPGHWQAALGQYGTPDAALAHAPPETRAYVPKVLGRMGAVDSTPASQTASGTIPARLPFGFAPKAAKPDNAPSGYRYSADGSHLEPIPGGPADTSGAEQDALMPEAVTNMAWEKILEGKQPQYSRGKSGDAIRNKVNNRVAEIAKQAGVSPAELATQSGRVKAVQGSLNNLQKRASMIETQAQTFSKNADLALSLVQKVSQGGSPAINKFKQNLKLKFMGDPNVAAYMAAVQTAQQEYAKIASGSIGAGGSTDSSRAESRELLNAASSPEQLARVVETMKQDIANQKAANDAELADLGTRMTQFGSTPAAPAAGGASVVWVRDPKTGKLVRGH